MARGFRQVPSGVIQHLIWHGMREWGLFVDDEDFGYFLDRMNKIAGHLEIKLYAYCLLSTHVHMLAEPSQENLPEFMQRLGSNYAVHFNKRYSLKGHVFSDRYWPIAVTNDRYLLTVSRYIHMNPSKAGIVPMPEAYAWSSCRAYLGYQDGSPVDTATILDYFRSGPQGRSRAIHAYRAYLHEHLEGDGLPPIRRVDGAWQYDDTPIASLGGPTGEEPSSPSVVRWGLILRIVHDRWNDLEALRIARPGSGLAQRNAMLSLGRRHAGLTWKELGELLAIEPAAARIAAKRFEDRLCDDGALAELLREMEEVIAGPFSASAAA